MWIQSTHTIVRGMWHCCQTLWIILDNLNPRNAVGAHGISPRLLRLSKPVMVEEITRLINVLIANRSWPDEWKCGNLTPEFKKDEDTRKENFHPVSVLTGLSKVCEKVMYDQLYNTFCRHLSQNLSGFIKNHWCCTALLLMTEDWRSSLDNRVSHVRGCWFIKGFWLY